MFVIVPILPLGTIFTFPVIYYQALHLLSWEFGGYGTHSKSIAKTITEKKIQRICWDRTKMIVSALHHILPPTMEMKRAFCIVRAFIRYDDEGLTRMLMSV